MAELTERQKESMRKHKKHHSSKHMKMMRGLMMEGASFSEAHRQAQKKVGK